MNQFYRSTPVFFSHQWKAKSNLEVHYKMDCFQPSGSFKLRGMENLCRHYFDKGQRKFIASSGGNAGYSLAYAGQKLGADVKVIVPETTSQTMIEKIEMLEAGVEVHGEAWDEAHHYALSVSEKEKSVYVPPFDHPLLWDGHSTIIDECVKQTEKPDKIVLAVGGGGLLCGVLQGMLRNGWEDVEVVTCETEGAASFAKSMEEGVPVKLQKIDSIATSLGAKQIAEKAFEMTGKFNITTHLCTDDQALKACHSFYGEYLHAVEPACGAALSYLHSGKATPEEKVLVIVCGGINLTKDQYQ